MTEKEAIRLVAIATANFPALQNKDMRPTAKLWHRMLSDVSYEEAEKALVKVLCTAKFFPTIADLREAVMEIKRGRQLTADEAWGLVRQAVDRYGYYDSEAAFKFLPPGVADLVRRFGWREICLCEDVEVLRGQFRRAWDDQAARQREEGVLPEEIRVLVTRTIALPERRAE